jgi:hypothetical protein
MKFRIFEKIGHFCGREVSLTIKYLSGLRDHFLKNIFDTDHIIVVQLVNRYNFVGVEKHNFAILFTL